MDHTAAIPARLRWREGHTRLVLGSPALALVVALLGIGCAGPRGATFDSPLAAVESLVGATRSNDTTGLARILGPGSGEIISSGDEVADANGREAFLKAYDEKHRLVEIEGGSMTLLVGASEWPLPIPIVREGGRWSFDTEAGVDELLSRRIGRNELSAIQVCLAIVDAQREYADGDPRKDGWREYAQKFVSDPRKRNGLYWPTGEGEPLSPLGELVAGAAAEGYTKGKAESDSTRPYRGYRYRIVKAQGADAPGGAFSYMAGGRMIGGFGVVAYPAEYGNSGIMTFIVSHNGVVHQRDLGSETERTARSMEAFNPGPEWKRAE